MSLKSHLLSFQILWAILAAYRPDSVHAQSETETPSINIQKIHRDITAVPLIAEDIILKTTPQKLDPLQNLVEQCDQKRQRLSTSVNVNQISIDDIIQKRNTQQCGAESRWEKGVHQAFKSTLNRPLDYVGGTIASAGKTVQDFGEKLPWGLRHITQLSGCLVNSIGGLTQTLNDTLTLTLPTTLIGRTPTKPISSLADIPLQIAETGTNTLRHVANVTYTTLQTPVDLVTDPLISVGDKMNTPMLSAIGQETQTISSGLLALATRFPIIAGDTATVTYRVALGKIGAEIPWRKTAALSLGLSEEDSLPFAEQFLDAYQDCLSDKIKEEDEVQKSGNLKGQLEYLSHQHEIPANKVPEYVQEARRNIILTEAMPDQTTKSPLLTGESHKKRPQKPQQNGSDSSQTNSDLTHQKSNRPQSTGQKITFLKRQKYESEH